MERRRFLAMMTGGLLAAPLAGGAQGVKVSRIGVLLGLTNPEHAQAGFREGLRELGYVDGQNILLEYRSAVGETDRLTDLAADLVQRKVDIIVADGTLATQAAKRATTEIPIVMTRAGDPIGTRLIESLARPGGHVTGVSSATGDLGGKLLELIREVRHPMTRVAVLAHATGPFAQAFVEQIQSAASRVRVRIQRVVARNAEEFDGALAAMVKERAAGVVVQPILANKSAADLALKHRLPSITTGVGLGTFPELGGLMSYGSNPQEFYRRAALSVDKIIKGSRPADLAVEQPTKFDLVVNFTTAKALGLTITRSLLARADQVIE